MFYNYLNIYKENFSNSCDSGNLYVLLVVFIILIIIYYYLSK